MLHTKMFVVEDSNSVRVHLQVSQQTFSTPLSSSLHSDLVHNYAKQVDRSVKVKMLVCVLSFDTQEVARVGARPFH